MKQLELNWKQLNRVDPTYSHPVYGGECEGESGYDAMHEGEEHVELGVCHVGEETFHPSN